MSPGGRATDQSAAGFLLRYPASRIGGLPEGLPLTATGVLQRLPRLRVVQSLSAGVDTLVPHVPAGAVLCSARGVHDASTAEPAVSLTVASLRGIPDFVRAQDAQEWRTGFRPAPADRTVLLLGHGAIAAAVEDRVTPFECEVLRVARSARTTARGTVHALADLPGLLPRADIVVVTVPLTQETRGLIEADLLARLRDGSLLVNVSGGAVVDTGALLAGLGTGRLSAALDVSDPEPLPAGHPFWRAPNTLISPHVEGQSSAFLPRGAAADARAGTAPAGRPAAGEHRAGPRGATWIRSPRTSQDGDRVDR